MLEYASELTGIIALVQSGNINALKSIAALEGVQHMESASKAIARKGYAIA